MSDGLTEPPNVANMVEAAHKRIHRMLGGTCDRDTANALRPGSGKNIACVELECAHAALDIDDGDNLAEMWRTDWQKEGDSE